MRSSYTFPFSLLVFLYSEYIHTHIRFESLDEGTRNYWKSPWVQKMNLFIYIHISYQKEDQYEMSPIMLTCLLISSTNLVRFWSERRAIYIYIFWKCYLFIYSTSDIGTLKWSALVCTFSLPHACVYSINIGIGKLFVYIFPITPRINFQIHRF